MLSPTNCVPPASQQDLCYLLRAQQSQFGSSAQAHTILPVRLGGPCLLARLAGKGWLPWWRDAECGSSRSRAKRGKGAELRPLAAMTGILCDWLNREVKLSRTVGESKEVGFHCFEAQARGVAPTPLVPSRLLQQEGTFIFFFQLASKQTVSFIWKPSPTSFGVGESTKVHDILDMLRGTAGFGVLLCPQPWKMGVWVDTSACLYSAAREDKKK